MSGVPNGGVSAQTASLKSTWIRTALGPVHKCRPSAAANLLIRTVAVQLGLQIIAYRVHGCRPIVRHLVACKGGTLRLITVTPSPQIPPSMTAKRSPVKDIALIPTFLG